MLSGLCRPEINLILQVQVQSKASNKTWRIDHRVDPRVLRVLSERMRVIQRFFPDGSVALRFAAPTQPPLAKITQLSSI